MKPRPPDRSHQSAELDDDVDDAGDGEDTHADDDEEEEAARLQLLPERRQPTKAQIHGAGKSHRFDIRRQSR